MKLTAAIALVVAAAISSTTAASARDAATPSPSSCGGQLWRLKTLSDRGRHVVELQPKTTTISDIAERPFPRPIPRVRRTPFQRQAWEVVAQITKFRVEASGIRLELFSAGTYLNAVMPTPACLTRATRARPTIAATFRQFVADCGQPTQNGWHSLGAVVHVRGVGFWSQRRGLRGSARNGAELHPVTGLSVVAGC